MLERLPVAVDPLPDHLVLGVRRDVGGVPELLGALLRVAPTFVSGDDLFSRVVRNFNAIEIVGDRVGPVWLHGQGAGPAPTSSAILSDVVEVAKVGSAARVRVLG